MEVDLKQVTEDLKQLHQSKSIEHAQQVAAVRATSKELKKIAGALKMLGEESTAKKPKPSKASASKQQVKDLVLTAALACLEKHGELSDTKLREAIKKSLPEIDLTGRLRRFSDWLRADGRMTEVSSGVWTLQTVAATNTASEVQQAETPAKRQLPPR